MFSGLLVHRLTSFRFFLLSGVRGHAEAKLQGEALFQGTISVLDFRCLFRHGVTWRENETDTCLCSVNISEEGQAGGGKFSPLPKGGASGLVQAPRGCTCFYLFFLFLTYSLNKNSILCFTGGFSGEKTILNIEKGDLYFFKRTSWEEELFLKKKTFFRLKDTFPETPLISTEIFPGFLFQNQIRDVSLVPRIQLWFFS